MRTFVSENGSEYTRTEVVKSQPVIDAYVRLMDHGTLPLNNGHVYIFINRPPSLILAIQYIDDCHIYHPVSVPFCDAHRR